MSEDSRVEELMRYYRLRAPEYEALYYRSDPERRAELETIARSMRELFRDRSVLEVACGTGYWTAEIADVVRSVTATDAATEMLSVAKSKQLPTDRVEFREADAYRLDLIPGAFDAGLAGFWLSHVPRSKLADFLTGFNGRLGSGAVVFMVENLNTPGYGGEFIEKPGIEDTFKRRELADGSTHDVIKNYYSEDQLREMFAAFSKGFEVHMASYYWWLSYEIL